MEDLASYLKPPTLLYGVFIYFVALMIRRVLERFFPSRWKSDPIWADVILPTLPAVIGALCALPFDKYPYPDDISHWYERAFLGAVTGFVSGWIYRIVKGVIKKATGIDPDGNSMPPPPGGDRMPLP
jgi:hypothetical protein